MNWHEPVVEALCWLWTDADVSSLCNMLLVDPPAAIQQDGTHRT